MSVNNVESIKEFENEVALSKYKFVIYDIDEFKDTYKDIFKAVKNNNGKLFTFINQNNQDFDKEFINEIKDISLDKMRELLK